MTSTRPWPEVYADPSQLPESMRRPPSWWLQVNTEYTLNAAPVHLRLKIRKIIQQSLPVYYVSLFLNINLLMTTKYAIFLYKPPLNLSANLRYKWKRDHAKSSAIYKYMECILIKAVDNDIKCSLYLRQFKPSFLNISNIHSTCYLFSFFFFVLYIFLFYFYFFLI